MYYFEQGVFMHGTCRCDESWKKYEVNIVRSQEISRFIPRKIPGILISCYNFLSKLTNQQS